MSCHSASTVVRHARLLITGDCCRQPAGSSIPAGQIARCSSPLTATK
jgi:hypothetical protein